MKIHEDFSNYTANPEQYIENVKNSIAKVHGISPEDVFIRYVKPGSVEVEYVILNFNSENERLNRLSTNDLSTELAQ